MSVASEFPAEGADRRITIEGADVLSTDAGALSAERPFPGLRPFAFADRAYFFGRERQIAALRNCSRTTPSSPLLAAPVAASRLWCSRAWAVFSPTSGQIRAAANGSG